MRRRGPAVVLERAELWRDPEDVTRPITCEGAAGSAGNEVVPVRGERSRAIGASVAADDGVADPGHTTPERPDRGKIKIRLPVPVPRNGDIVQDRRTRVIEPRCTVVGLFVLSVLFLMIS